MARFMGVSEAARHLKLDKSVVSRQARAWGVTKDEQGRIDVDAYVAARDAHLDVAKQGNHAGLGLGELLPPVTPAPTPSEPAPPSALTAARTDREELAAERLRLRLQAERGELVPREEVAADGAEAARVLKRVLLLLPARIAGDLAVETDPHRIEERLAREIDTALEAMSEACANGDLARQLRGGAEAGSEGHAIGVV